MMGAMTRADNRMPSVHPGLRLCLLGLFSLGCAWPSASAAEHLQPNFAQPFTGNRVESYEVTLPIGRTDNAVFSVPGRCIEVESLYLSGAGQWGSQLERHLWLKVINDCEYHRVLFRYASHPRHDFVSGYDFGNARFEDLPLWPECLQSMNDAPCGGAPPGFVSIPDMLGPPPAPRSDETDLGRDCQIRDGVFRGHLVPMPGGIKCVPDKRAPGFRLLSVDFADINGDGYLDAVLRLLPLGLRLTRTPVLLPLTRKTGTESFSAPKAFVPPPLPRSLSENSDRREGKVD